MRRVTRITTQRVLADKAVGEHEIDMSPGFPPGQVSPFGSPRSRVTTPFATVVRRRTTRLAENSCTIPLGVAIDDVDINVPQIMSAKGRPQIFEPCDLNIAH